jgi:hypothetical protein
MKKIMITAFAMLLAAVTVFAQDGLQRKATGYIKDGVQYYQVTGCTPYSELEFYSTPSGGDLLAAAPVNNLGEAVIKVPADAAYAFALNRVKATKKGEAGLAYYIALGTPVMEVKTVSDDAGVLRWQVITGREGITSEVYSSNDGAPFAKLATLNQADAAGDDYSYTAASHESGKTIYCIQVTDPASGLKVTLGRNMMSKEAAAMVKVSPSIFTDVVNVQLFSSESGTIQVFSNIGNLVYSSTVKQGNNSINLYKLAAAGYIIKITGLNKRILYNGRVVKSR